MLQLLLDEHVPPVVADRLRVETPPIDAEALRDWHDGDYLGAPDDVLLNVALNEGRTLVTYDVRTIPPLLKSWAEQGIDHGGIIFVDRRTIASNDVGAFVKGLAALFDRESTAAWQNRVIFLTRQKGV